MILAAVLAAADADGDLDWTVSVDSTVVRAHQHAAGACKRGRPARESPPITRSARQRETAGRSCEPGSTRLRIPGRPRTRPLAVLADRAYSSRGIRNHLRRRGIRAVIPQPSDQVGHRLRRGRLGGRPPGLDSEAYKQRNTVERWINRLKQWRGLATRTAKLAIAYQAALHLAGILIWTRRRPKRQHRGVQGHRDRH